MNIKVFGRSGCARTRKVLLCLRRWLNGAASYDRVRVEFYDLGTVEGLAEAAFQQLEGDLPAVLVDAKVPGVAISGERPSQGRMLGFQGKTPGFGVVPSWN